MTRTTIEEFEKNFDAFFDLVRNGEEIGLFDGAEPVARIQPISSAEADRMVGE